MYLSGQLFFKTPDKTLKLQQKLLPLQTKKNISKHDRTEVFSTDIHEKNMFNHKVQAMLLQSEAVPKIHFPAI